MSFKMNYVKTITVDDMIKNIISIPDEILLELVQFKITEVHGSKDLLKIDVVGFYNNVIVYTNRFDFIPTVADDSPNFLKQGYTYLKTLDEFKDAIDC